MQHKVKRIANRVTEGDYLYGIDDLALFLRVCGATTRRLHQEGKFPVYRRGRKLMFKKSEVLEGLKEKAPPAVGASPNAQFGFHVNE